MVAQSRPWCLLASCPPSDLCPEWIKPGLSTLDDWRSFQHHHCHCHHTLSTASCDTAPFLASEWEPHVGSWRPDGAVFIVLKVWTYSSASLECKFSPAELMRRTLSKASEMPPLTGASCSSSGTVNSHLQTPPFTPKPSATWRSVLWLHNSLSASSEIRLPVFSVKVLSFDPSPTPTPTPPPPPHPDPDPLFDGNSQVRHLEEFIWNNQELCYQNPSFRIMLFGQALPLHSTLLSPAHHISYEEFTMTSNKALVSAAGQW